MPFTAAHPAIVLPLMGLKGRYASATGLICGSIAPDFEYFFKLSVDGIYGHTFWGLLYFNLPVATLLAVVFHQVVKHNLVANLPGWLQQRLWIMVKLDFREYLSRHMVVFLISCWIGAASHILWDSFTHNSGYFASRLAIYDQLKFDFMGTRYPLFFVLQHVSSIVGMAAILIYVVWLPRDPNAPIKPVRPRYWLGLGATPVVVIAARFLIRPADLNLGNLVVTFIAGFCIGLIIFGLSKKHGKNQEHWQRRRHSGSR